MTNEADTEVERLTYDPRGARRNPADWTQPDIRASHLFARGYTLHEHLDDYGLINMNGRVYDPLMAQFLSPDPHIQAPGSWMNYNRYAYCLNNPLKYTDPSGEKWWHWLLGDVFTGGAVSMFGSTNTAIVISTTFANTVAQTSVSSFFNTNQSSNSWEIWNGLFKTDPNLSGGNRLEQFLSRFTWEAPQSLLGYAASDIHNLFGGVKSVDYYGGATVIETYSESWGGFTLGSYIVGHRGIAADPNNRLFQHEYGHYLQSQSSGWFYLSKYGIPSALSKNGTDHSLHPAEQDANVRAFRYFNKYVTGYAGWNHNVRTGNPIVGYNQNLPYNDAANQAALNNGRLRLAWYDYLLGPSNASVLGIVVPGLINAIYLNQQY
ncbi:MAG: RHS repeat-associated core domain-containing protein [Breznakibacter sp.]